MILHLIPAPAWEAARSAPRYAPDSLAVEGFVHCTGDDATLLDVANRFYGASETTMLVLGIDETGLSSDVRWEPPAHPDGRPAGADDPLFPHIYGPIDTAAVVEVRTMHRDGVGRFVSIS